MPLPVPHDVPHVPKVLRQLAPQPVHEPADLVHAKGAEGGRLCPRCCCGGGGICPSSDWHQAGLLQLGLDGSQGLRGVRAGNAAGGGGRRGEAKGSPGGQCCGEGGRGGEVRWKGETEGGNAAGGEVRRRGEGLGMGCGEV